MQIAIALFDDVTALDAVGPYAVLSRVPGAEVVFVAAAAGPVPDDRGMLTLHAAASFAEVPAPDIAVVPGGLVTRRFVRDGHAVIDWVRAVHPGTEWTASVCTGSLVLGAAGLLAGRHATTHWSAYDDLAALGAEPTSARVVFARDAHLVTGAGVSAGIDLGLHLAAELAGADVAQEIQLSIEYDPQPPFSAGSPAAAPPEILARARERSARQRAALMG